MFFYSSGNIPPWVIVLKILLSNDVETNPGDFINEFFSFCNWQVQSFTEIILNIMSNFIANRIIQVVPISPPWINKTLKNNLKRIDSFKKYKKHGYKPCDKIRVDNFQQECESEVLKAKENYLKTIENKLVEPKSSQKSCWKLINGVMNKCKAPKIPPLLINNKFIINCKEMAVEFASFFSSQCKPILNDSTLPNFTYRTNEWPHHIPFIYSYMQP